MRLKRCDPQLDPVSDPAESVDIELAPGATHAEHVVFLASEFGLNICGISVHYEGLGTGGLLVRASAHFETPTPTLFETEVINPEILDLMNDAAAGGLLQDP